MKYMKLFNYSILVILIFSLFLAGCGTPADSSTTTQENQLVEIATRGPASQSYEDIPVGFTAEGFPYRGGDPRSAGYWLLWNACAPENKAEVAAAKGGLEAGWFLMDDLLADPGILVGALPVETCDQGVNLLQAKDLGGAEMKNDPAFFI